MIEDMQNAIRFAICQGWVRTLSNPKSMPLVSSGYRGIPSHRNGRVPNVTMTDCRIINCGTAFKLSGDSFIEMNQTYVSGCNTFAEVDGNSRLDVNHSQIEDCQILVKES